MNDISNKSVLWYLEESPSLVGSLTFGPAPLTA